MKILFLSAFEPALSGGPPRLLYDILCSNETDHIVDFCVVEKSDITISLPEKIKYVSWNDISKKPIKGNKIFSFPFVRFQYTRYSHYSISLSDYQIFIAYPYQISLLTIENFEGKIITIGMDCASLLFLRGFLYHKSILMKLACLIRLMQTTYLEKKVSTISSNVVTVGNTDTIFYQEILYANSTFIRHPINDFVFNYSGKNWDTQEKLKLCFAGALSKFYSGYLLTDLLTEFIKKKEILADKVSIHFLGTNNTKIAELAQNGYEIHVSTYVNSFEEYLSSMHILLVPLLVGSGTKNRVLSALGLGIDVIGTEIAFENIFGINEIHLAHTAKDFIDKITYRLSNKYIYRLTDVKKRQFFEEHSRTSWSRDFWNVL